MAEVTEAIVVDITLPAATIPTLPTSGDGTPFGVADSPIAAVTIQAGAAAQAFHQALAHEELEHRARLERWHDQRHRQRRHRRGRVGQQPRRQLENEVRQQAVAFARDLRQAGGTLTQAATLLNLTPRTLRHWDARCQARRLAVLPLGRPAARPEPATRQAVLDFLQQGGAQTSVAGLQRHFAACARAELAELRDRYRRVLQQRYPQTQHVLHWLVAGSVWAIDFAQPGRPGEHGLRAPVDDRFPYLLAVGDLASGYVLAWQPVAAATAAVTAALLAQLFAAYQPPLVLKLDNGPAFRDAQVQRFLDQAGVLLLYSPPACPAYNGSIEATIGSLKTRTEHQAARHGRSACWTAADVAAARDHANQAQPRRLHGRTPTQAWAARRPLIDAERVRLTLAVERERFAERIQQGIPLEAELDHWTHSAVDRMALPRALEEHGYLLFRRRRIHLPIRSRRVANI